ncbi:alpha-amylase [Pseudoalteromonas rubra]|uniref:Alpha-amylase n=1 Tax=Pseudoalteromonas rubra TaxID=43658 RepID=A0A5S3UT78_9GAMM|nr:alpha-amylase [Pseudoalteromonas rubra]
MIKQSLKVLNTALIAAGLGMSAQALATPTTFVHLFEWSWQDIATECETFLGPKGYAAVQVSPPSEHITGAPWWTRYQPVSYQLESRSGNRAQFIDMVTRCKAAGVDIYVDAVINHMAHGSGTGVAGSTFGDKHYPIYSPQDFHETCAINDADYGNNAWRVQNCELVGLADLNTSASYVQNTLAGYLNDLVGIGVAGFRLDASKHMASSDIAAIMGKVSGDPLVFQEVIDQGGQAVRADEYFANGLVTEFKYSTKLGDTFKSGKLAWLSSFGEAWDMMPSYLAVVFVDNHDNQRGHGGAGNVVTYEDGALYDLANVFMLAYPYGYPKVMSSYDFNHDGDAGPPGSLVHQGSTLNCFANEWQCEHRRSMIAGAMDFRNNTTGHWTVNNWWDNGNNQIAFSRGDEGFVAINREGFSLNQTLQTGLTAGVYCDVLSGGKNTAGDTCLGNQISVDQNGLSSINIGAMNAVAIHHNSKLGDTPTEPVGDWQRTVVFIKAETAAGEDLFVRGGLDHTFAASLGRNCDQDPLQCAMPVRHNNLKNPTTQGWKQGDNYLDWHGAESGQSAEALGSALDWTTNLWPAEWGTKATVESHGYGETPLNQWGAHYWMLDVDMDCSQSHNGWFEIKAFVKNGEGWEGDINQANTPYSSNNHFARCGQISVFEFNQSTASYIAF